MQKLFKTRLFFQVIMASLVATLATVGIVAATTTIGTSINTGGTLTVTSTTATSTISTGGLTVGTNQFVVQQTSGHVGIGTTNPGSNLEVYNSSGISAIKIDNGATTAGGGYSQLRLFASASQAAVDHKNFAIVNSNAAVAGGGNLFSIQLRKDDGTNNSTLLSITDLGFTSLRASTYGLPETSGTTQTYGTLRIGNAGTDIGLDLGSARTTGTWLQSTLSSDLSQTYPLLLNPNGGNVGIGTSTPTTQLQITASATNATTTVTMGKVGQNKGTCHEEFRTDGSTIYWWWTIEGAVATSSASCK